MEERWGRKKRQSRTEAQITSTTSKGMKDKNQPDSRHIKEHQKFSGMKVKRGKAMAKIGSK